MNYSLYCDGSTKANGSSDAVGAWAYAIINEYNSVITYDFDAKVGVTNQKMELQAALAGLMTIVPLCVFPHDSITVYTDSAYLCNCVAQKWYKNWQRNGWVNTKRQPVANKELWEQLIPFFETFGITFVKVKGHAANRDIHEVWNNYVDDLAQSAASMLQEKLNESNCH